MGRHIIEECLLEGGRGGAFLEPMLEHLVSLVTFWACWVDFRTHSLQVGHGVDTAIPRYAVGSP